MAKKKDLAKVAIMAVEKEQDAMSLEYSKVEGSPDVEITRTEETLLKTTGFRMDHSADYLLLKVLNALLKAEDSLEKKSVKGNQILSTMIELRPRDGYEGFLISQMILVFDQAMECFRMADKNKSFAEMYFSLQNQGIKLMRLYAQQLEALDKHRNKGKQKMVVEHIHVNRGGQAIVGSVTQGGGVKIKNKEQPQVPWVLNNGNKPLDLRSLPRCQAMAKSTGRRCGNPAMKGKEVCYIHGGKSTGAPKENNNAIKHGRYTAEAIERNYNLRMLLKHSKRLIKKIGGF